MTCIDHSGVPHIIATALRMGNGKSHTDNFMTGGIACFVDPETGVIVTDGVNLEGKTFKAHPISGIVYKGFQVPHWAEARNLAFFFWLIFYLFFTFLWNFFIFLIIFVVFIYSYLQK